MEQSEVFITFPYFPVQIQTCWVTHPSTLGENAHLVQNTTPTLCSLGTFFAKNAHLHWFNWWVCAGKQTTLIQTYFGSISCLWNYALCLRSFVSTCKLTWNLFQLPPSPLCSTITKFSAVTCFLAARKALHCVLYTPLRNNLLPLKSVILKGRFTSKMIKVIVFL